jgi:hypothetical protein
MVHMIKSMKSIKLWGVILMAACIVALAAFSSFTSFVIRTENITIPTAETLAQCMTEKGAVMYGTEWCGHCTNQKKAFGAAFEHISYVDCEKELDACQEKGILYTPAWEIDGELKYGEMSLRSLSGLTGCPY